MRHLPPQNIDGSVTEIDVYLSGFVKVIYSDCPVVCLAITSCGRKRGSSSCISVLALLW